MDSELEIAELMRWTRIMNARGHASLFAYETREDRQTVERCTAIEWSVAVRNKFGVNVTSISSTEDDPPDCIGELDGTRISIELTELVDGDFLAAVRKSGGEVSSYRGEGFCRTQWSRARFQDALVHRLKEKGTNYARRGIEVDVLIVYTAETWLDPRSVEDWLGQFALAPSSSMKSAYLLMSYRPSYSDLWPVFRLY